MQHMTVMAFFLSFFHIHLHTLILGVHFDVQKLGFLFLIIIILNYPNFFYLYHINKKLFSLLMLMLHSVNARLKDAMELYHTLVKRFEPLIHQYNYVFLNWYQLLYSLAGVFRKHKESSYMICNSTTSEQGIFIKYITR